MGGQSKKNLYTFDKNEINYKNYDPEEKRIEPPIDYDYERYKANIEKFSPSKSKAFENNDLIKDSYQNPFTIPAERKYVPEIKKNSLKISSSQMFYEATVKERAEREQLESQENLSPMNSNMDFNKNPNIEIVDQYTQYQMGVDQYTQYTNKNLVKVKDPTTKSIPYVKQPTPI